MEWVERKSFQGIKNILRFNWHYFVVAILSIVLLITIAAQAGFHYKSLLLLLSALLFLNLLISLSVSWYVYDCSDLYSLHWLRKAGIQQHKSVINIHAGFDETSQGLARYLQPLSMKVYDFYDPARHTEISIERARKTYPAYPGTIKIATDNFSQDEKEDYIFLILAAHEIRDQHERTRFFNLLRKTLHHDGKIVVVEHLRDLPNFIAYTIGFFHFHSLNTWKKTFKASRLNITDNYNITPFIKVFILQSNDLTP